MSIGIYDEDLARYHAVPFNLEAMKLSSYYKKQNEIVKLTDSFCPEKYTKFFYIKDIADGEYIPNLHKYDNLTYQGMSFTNQHYISMPEDIEKMKPDTFIYVPFQEKYYTTAKDKRSFSSFLSAQHIRISLDGETVWPNFYCQYNDIRRNKTIFLHDYDITKVSGARDAILTFRNDIKGNNKPGLVAFKFPIRVHTGQQLIDWTGSWTHGTYLPIQICGMIPDEALYEYIHNDSRLNTCRPTEYIVTMNCRDDDDFLIRVLPQIFKQVIFLRMNRKEFSLKYEEGFFSNKVLEKLVILLSSYCGSPVPMTNGKGKKDSLFCFCQKLQDYRRYKNYSIIKDEAREVFQFVREKNYEVFKDFYELHSVILKGDKFVNE